MGCMEMFFIRVRFFLVLKFGSWGMGREGGDRFLFVEFGGSFLVW